MIPIPFKFTPNADLAAALTKYLAPKYAKEELARYADLLKEFESLRNGVCAITQANEGAAEALMIYYATSEKAAEKFPCSETVIKVAFTWTDVLRPRRQVTQYNWAFERANVLFNLAALESQVAASTNRDSASGIEAATKHFANAAGIFFHLRDTVASKLIGSVPLDLTRDGLSMVGNLMLAQAQACVYEMARERKSKPELCARLAGHAADLYRAALRSFADALYAEIDVEFPWSAYLRFYSMMFDAASFYQYSIKIKADAEASGNGYGTEIAWLTVAENACKAALDVGNIKHKLVSSIPAASAAMLLQTISGRREAAIKDNNTIYFQPVAAPKDLPLIPRAEVARPAPVPDFAAKCRDLFASIVPSEVAAALTLADDRLGLLTAEAKDRATKASEEARSMLTSLGLPGYLDAGESGESGLPAQLWDRVRKTQIEGGVAELERLYAANTAAATAAKEILRQVAEVLDKEAAEDEEQRRMYADKWTAAPSQTIAAELRGDLAKFNKVSEVAAASDVQVRAKLDTVRPKLVLLEKSKSELDALVPAGASGPVPGSPADIARSQLKDAVKQLQSLMDSRQRLAQEIKDKFDRSGAISTLLATPPGDHSSVVERLVTAPSPARAAFEENLSQQIRLLDMIKTQHARYAEVRASDERTRAREAAIQDIAVAVDKYEEIRGNLKEGQKFYGDLRGHADTLLGTARGLAEARSLQRRELLLTIRGDPGTSHAPAGYGGPRSPVAAQSAYPAWSSGPAAVTPVPLPPTDVATRATSDSLVAANAQGPVSFNPFDAFDSRGPPSTASSHASSSHPSSGPPSTSTYQSGYATPSPAHAGYGPAPGMAPPAGYPPYAAPGSQQYAPQPAPGYGHAPSGYSAPAPPAPSRYGPPAPAMGPPHGGYYGAPAPGPAPTGAYGYPPGASAYAAPGVNPKLRTLLDMGFSRADAEAALHANGDDLDRAIAALLSRS